MEAVVIVTVLALIQYMYFGVQVGVIREKTGARAPASTGPDEFERVNRVHLNTLEQLVFFLPVLWMYAHYVNPLWGAGLGVVYLVGRVVYRSSYIKDPASRSMGFMMTLLPSVVMAVWVLVVAILSYV